MSEGFRRGNHRESGRAGERHNSRAYAACREHRMSSDAVRLIKRIERRNRVRITAAVIIAVIVTFIATFAGMKLSERPAGADSLSLYDRSGTEIAYRTVRIGSGDTLWTIAEREMDASWADRREFIDLVKSTNGISGDLIHAGSYLCVPYHL